MQRTRNDDGLVYRGACDLIHIADGKRAETGEWLARLLGDKMRDDRFDAAYYEALDAGEPIGAALTKAREDAQQRNALCPGCYMVALFNAAVTLAKANGQSLTELGNSMAGAFRALADGGADRMESITVALDGDDVSDSGWINSAGEPVEAPVFDTLPRSAQEG